MNVTFYTTNCPRCRILKQKLDKAHVEYTTCTDIQEMLVLGQMSAPFLKIDDEDLYLFKEACVWADDYARQHGVTDNAD